MKNIIAIILLLCATLSNAQEKETLTNQSIIDMTNLGFSEDIIVAKINTSNCLFNISIDSLNFLKQKGVGNNTILAMMNICKLNQESQKSLEESISGIFYKDKGELKKIYPTVFSGSKTNTLGSALTYGIASSKIKSTIPGRTSRVIISHTLPEFVFLFKDNANNDSSNWMFSTASSPNQFVLVKLTQKYKSRELETGKVNLYSGTSVGVPEDVTVQFDIEMVDETEFKVTPRQVLDPGEYCFFYQGAIPVGGYSNQSIFDFSIPSNAFSPAKYKRGDVVYVKFQNKIRKCEITHIIVNKDGISYKGINTLEKTYEWNESSCSLNKEDL